MTDRLQRFSQKYAHICSLSSIGQSVEGRELWVMRITTNQTADEPGKPRFKYVGNIHGDEALSRQLSVYLIEYLLTQYGRDVRVTELVDRTDIYIMASMNPDGSERAVEGDCSGSSEGRENAKHYDLDKSFSDRDESFSKTSEDLPEVTAVMKWILEKKFVLSGSLHGGSVMATYPFDDGSSYATAELTADEAVFRHLAQTYTENHPIMRMDNPDCPDVPDKNLGDGIDMLTWAYHSTDTLAVNIGLSCELLPPEELLSEYWEKNYGALLHFIQQVHLFVRGMVTDGHSGKGIANATVVVEGSSHYVHTSSTGQYWRPLAPGSYHITASAPGYTPISASVRVLETRVEQVDFKLTRGTLSVEEGEQKDFEKLVEWLLAPGELDQLVRSLLPAQTLRYRTYRERSEFLRGLTLNFPRITRLYRYVVLKMCLYFLANTANHLIKVPLLCLFEYYLSCSVSCSCM
uniref:Carboxypeptidase D, b n=1 Tax=Sinocyclocheilus grahami TaxID=75366 RepID=A0A672RRC1_SINGR